jgi:hypothetical protein
MKFIITESQYKLLNEAVGVPDFILDAAEKLYSEVEKHVKSIDAKQTEYEFEGDLDVELGDKKKIKIDDYELVVRTETFDDYNEKPQVISMSVVAYFGFDRDTLRKHTEPSKKLEFNITFAVSEDWEPYDLYVAMEKDKVFQIASLAHELKHKYDKQVKQGGLIGDDAEYQSTQRKDNFGIPVIDHEFFRNMYFVSMVENLVRPTEVASQMRSLGVTKSGFREFLENERVYKELLEIRDFTFEHFISKLKEQMNRVDILLKYIGKNPEEMTEDEKINEVLEIVYISIVNTRMELFMDMTSKQTDNFLEFAQSMGILPDFMENETKGLERVNVVRQKYLNFTKRFKDNPAKFFESECKKFTEVASKMIKKIGKLHSIAKDDDTQVTESIINWELHQQLMEKKFGKRKIETKIKYKY